jgi:hypothetical protein
VQSSEHTVQIYEDLDELAGSVAAYLAEGFEAGEPAIVLATREHLSSFVERLAAAGWDTQRIEEHGLLTVVDADSALASIMRNGAPSPIAFEAMVGNLLDDAAKRFPGKRTRAFGELVNVLCERGEPGAAEALEELWNDLARHRALSLLCGYRLNVFDRTAQLGTLPAVCRSHSHVRAADDTRLARAVETALDDVLGPARAGEVYVLIGREIREARVPIGQLALMWVSENLPAHAERVLGTAQAHYAAARA